MIRHLARRYGDWNFVDVRVRRARTDPRPVLLEYDINDVRDLTLGTFVQQGWCMHIVDIEGENDYFTFRRRRLVSPPTPTRVDKNSIYHLEQVDLPEPLRAPQVLRPASPEISTSSMTLASVLSMRNY